MPEILIKIKTLPPKPGVYLFKDSRGEVIYIGKAVNLKNRVRSYFQKGQQLPRTKIMIQQIADLEYRIVSSEIESLILENILIKQYKPRFNVRLRDDKNYQFIKIDYDLGLPQIYTVRNLPGKRERKAKYFGPYTSGLSVRHTLNLIKRIFRLCRNKKIGARPCFAYHLGRCPGVCIGEISIEKYRETFHQIERFLAHRQTEILADLKREMKDAAKQQQYERAAIARDKIFALEHLWEKQKIVSSRKENQDFLGIYRTEKEAIITILQVRTGRLINQENFMLEHEGAANPEILEKFMLQYFVETSEIPKEVFAPALPTNLNATQTALGGLGMGKIRIVVPTRGKKSQLLKLASENAENFYQKELSSFEKRLIQALPELQTLLKLPQLPRRIEGFDISNIQGTNPVGSMVVFVDARPAKSQYRKFIIKSRTVSAESATAEKADDFAMMREMLIRRFKHRQEQAWSLPDLIIIDGGKGHLNVATSVLTTYNLQLPVIGLAKRLEEIFIPGLKDSIILPADSPVLYLLQQIRDEAHRFAISFHRKRRSKSEITSRLEETPGIGPQTRKKLIARFGSTKGVKQASFKELAAIVGPKKAHRLKERVILVKWNTGNRFSQEFIG